MSFFSHKSTLLTIAKFAIPAVIIGFLLWRIEPEQWHQLESQDKNYGFLAAALGVALGAMAISFVRWCILVRCQGIELTMLEAFRLGAISFLLSFVSAGSVGGDLFKAIFLAKRRPGRRVAAVASVLVDRACGLYALVLIAAVAFLLVHPLDREDGSSEWLGHIKLMTTILLVVGTVVLAVLVLGGKRVDRWISARGQSGLIGRVLSHVAPPLRMFHSHPVALGVAILMSVALQLSFVFSLYLIALGLYGSPPTLLEHGVIVPIGMLASALPITPAGIGVFEVVIQTLYSIVPAVPTEASGTLVALVFEIVKLVMAILGTVFYWTASDEERASLEAAEGEVVSEVVSSEEHAPMMIQA